MTASPADRSPASRTTVENAVRGLAQFDLDFLTVHGDPHVVRAAKEGAAGKEGGCQLRPAERGDGPALQQGLDGYTGVEDSSVSSLDWDSPPQHTLNAGLSPSMTLSRDAGDSADPA